jgi:hypothetical protein
MSLELAQTLFESRMTSMSNYYLDIETTGPNPVLDKIITIQFVELNRNTSEVKGELKILKEWEKSERDILLQFISQCKVADPYPFSFVSIGYNLSFEQRFIMQRCRANGLPPIDILKKPFIDLKHISVIMNRGEFLGSGLDKITGKPHNGKILSIWYKEKKWNAIINYVKTEAFEFIRFSSWLYEELPLLRIWFKALAGYQMARISTGLE